MLLQSTPTKDAITPNDSQELNRRFSRAHNREGRRRALLRAASELFAAQGFDRTTTRQIALRAGCAEGLIHRYFGGKAGLLPALIEAEMVDETTPSPALSSSAPDPEQEILQLLKAEIQNLSRHAEILRVVVPQVLLKREMGELWRGVLGPEHRKNGIRIRLLHLQSSGLLSDAQVEPLAEALVTLAWGLVLARHLVFGSDLEDTLRLNEVICRALSPGFLAAPPATSIAAESQENPSAC